MLVLCNAISVDEVASAAPVNASVVNRIIVVYYTNDVYCSSSIVHVIKSRIMRWAGHGARMGSTESCRGFWWGNMREGDHLEDPSVDVRIILIWIFKKWNVGTWTGHICGSGQGQVVGTCECGNKPLSSIICREFLD
jgi:hypothetical protein